MLDLFARHAVVDLTVRANGDLHVDQHHTVEDIGICLGQAVKEALVTKLGFVATGTTRYRWKKHLCQSLSTSAVGMPWYSTLNFQRAVSANLTASWSRISGKPLLRMPFATFTSTYIMVAIAIISVKASLNARLERFERLSKPIHGCMGLFPPPKVRCNERVPWAAISIDIRFEESREFVEITGCFDVANDGDERLRVNELLKWHVF